MTSQYGAYALRAGLAGLYARIRMHTHMHPGTHTRARTRKHAHTDQYIILMLFHSNNGYVIRTLPILFKTLSLVNATVRQSYCLFRPRWAPRAGGD